MSKLFQFVSFALGTQVILLLNQVLLLPLQVRLWGNTETALWYTAVAIATVMTVADFGLRTAGHPDLLRLFHEGDAAAAERFAHTWAWIRLCLFGSAALLIAAEVLYGASHAAWHRHPWPVLLTLAYALEATLIVRIVFLDSVGAYRGAEAGYFVFAALRLALALPALLLWHWGPARLGVLYLLTAAAGLLLQGRLCRVPAALHIFAALPARLEFRAVSEARYTVAEPSANWARLSLPVLVVAAIAPPAAVTLFVALRAVFGAGRTTIQQIARVASVEYIRLRSTSQPEKADRLLSLAMLMTAFAGTALGAGVIGDNLRILGLWLPHASRPLFGEIALAFALTAAFYSYQIVVAVLFRTGRLAAVAHRHYAYVLCAGISGILARITHMFALYLALLVLAEAALAGSFLLGSTLGRLLGYATGAGRRTLRSSFAGMGVILALWIGVRSHAVPIFTAVNAHGFVATGCLLLLALLILLGFSALSNPDLVRALMRRRWFRGAPARETLA